MRVVVLSMFSRTVSQSVPAPGRWEMEMELGDGLESLPIEDMVPIQRRSVDSKVHTVQPQVVCRGTRLRRWLLLLTATMQKL